MCFELGSCFGKGRREDYGGERSTPNPTTARAAGRRKAGRRNGYYSGTDHRAPAPAYPHGARAAVDEPGHREYHGGARKDHHAGGYAAYVQAETNTLKLPAACHNKLGDHAGYTYTYGDTARLHEAAADHGENAPLDYHQYPTTTTDTTMARY